ncbi:hypothetical protein ACFPOD_04755 [Nitratireductor kimnyeongensis]|uniref:Dephospho-CoA kinase n=1 Tax=Nitratireductor kimnyeongensis TaxID=430679 RepID=A0ABW0T4V0_9HYPH|nr:hypothetical protein [Nitratireductor kimnyeongensis]QZZ34604.1 hypothetical protein KW403_12440 [Nitratireductor kimnyeongensis]
MTPINDNNPTPANRPVMVGLTGKRNVGKTTLANLLEEEFGFNRIHAFGAGKEAALTWFAEATGNVDRAVRMVYGDLKDKPCADLPGGVAPRYFLEKFGHFMGVDLGVDWTLAVEINKARRESPHAPIVVESVVYEAEWFRRAGGVIVRLERPDFKSPEGVESDAAQGLIDADVTISAGSVEELEQEGRRLVDWLAGERRAA